jgi:putative transposase
VVTTVCDRTHAPAPNVLKRQFVATRPNQIWVADITYIPTREGWVYLAVVLDVFARRVVGWAIQATLDQTLTSAALAMAIHQRHPPVGLIHHSDRGSQYTSATYQRMLAQIGATVSMSRRGNCWDNAVMESFFATLKVEIGTRVFPSHGAARSALFAYMEGFYNRQRCHSYLGYATPLQAEMAWSH